jgi:hypothetical protein
MKTPQQIKNEVEKEKITKKFEQLYNGLHWIYKNNKGESLSIICHDGSYGWENGEFETMCSWLKDVQGHLSFGQVQQKINTFIKRSKLK